MGENNCKWTDWHRINFQNIQAARYQKNKQPNQKMGGWPKQTFLQRKHTDGQQTHEKMLNLSHHECVCVCVCVWVAQLCPTLCDSMDCSPLGFSVRGALQAKNTGVGCHFLLQGIFLTQGSNLGLLHCRQMLYRNANQNYNEVSPHTAQNDHH